MNTQDFKRKLTAVFSADVAGYSRLMGEDEAATVKTLEAYKQVMFSLIKQRRGRVVDSPGDNLLAEFVSVVDAVQCGVAVQKELQSRNADLPENRRMHFRIGINVGDVIEEQDRIYGDGVNIAARLESLAPPGGICVSKTAFDQIEGKLALSFESLGEQAVKNIAKPVEAYRVLAEPRISNGDKTENAKIGHSDKPPLQLPDNPSIAVLPFVNMSGDPEQEYFSDGISEDIMTCLSQLPQVFVIARNSTFIYKGKPVNVQQVSRELGVKYVLEGSIRKMGNRVRITAQLIDGTTGHHIWAERYDRNLEDTFAVQDDIAFRILKELQVKLTDGEQARLYSKGTQNIEAYLKMYKARSYLYHLERGSNILARQICNEVIELTPEWELPHSVLGWTHLMDVRGGWTDSAEESVREAFQCAQKAISLNESPIAHALLSWTYTVTKQYEKAIEEAEKSVALGPNSADAYAWYANTLIMVGDPVKAISLIENALRLNPFPPGWYFLMLGVAYRVLGRYEEAIETLKKAIDLEPRFSMAHLALAVAYVLGGKEREACAEAKEVLRIEPRFSLERYAKVLPVKDQADRARIVAALRKAGLQ